MLVRCCALVDEQSKDTFADEQLATKIAVSAQPCEYSLETLAGITTRIQGLEVRGLEVRGSRSEKWHDLPPAFTGSHLPDTRGERATQEVVRCIPSLAHIADQFDPEDSEPEVLLLIGKNMPWISKIECHGEEPPFAHKNILGWSIVGTVEKDLLPKDCLAVTNSSASSTVFRGGITSEVCYTSSTVSLPAASRAGDTVTLLEASRPGDIVSHSVVSSQRNSRTLFIVSRPRDFTSPKVSSHAKKALQHGSRQRPRKKRRPPERSPWRPL